MEMNSKQSNNHFQYIGDRVVEEMKNKGLEGKYLASFLKGEYDRTQDSTEAYITLIRSGYVLGTKKGAYATPKNLGKLSIFLYAIGIQDDDGLIHDLKEMYGGNFLYPPTEGVPFNKIKPRTSNMEIVKEVCRPLHGDVKHTIFTKKGSVTEIHQYRRTPRLDDKSLLNRFFNLEEFILQYYDTV